MSDSQAVEIIQLCHRYNKYLAVDHISLEIPPGMIFGLIGPNGAGKSTTIKMLTTLLPVTSGQAYINGFSVIDSPSKVRQSIGYVPQLLSADGDLTAYENLLLSANLYGLTPSHKQERIRTILNFMNLSEYKDKLVNSFSGGMIRRLEIGQALIHEPAVLFLDEPSVGLDPVGRKMVWKHIFELRRAGMTIFMTTHDMYEAETLCDTIALMHHGRIVVMDTPTKLKSDLGPGVTLDDVFISHTGSSLNETQDFQDVGQTRRTIADL